jgi:uncharacterized SAM-binding protein YcdF (DUF218 family)
MQPRTYFTARRLWRIALVGLAAAFLLPTLCALAIYQYGQTDRAAPAEVLVVLGAGTRPSGAPSATHVRRIQHAAALYEQGYAPFVLCTGGYTARHPKSEGRACADYLLELGLPAEAILLEERSRSTEENAIEAAAVMAARGWTRALLVSDSYHLLRAELMFRAQGLVVSSSPAQVTSGPLSWRSVYSNFYRELAALGWWAVKSALGLQVTYV